MDKELFEFDKRIQKLSACDLKILEHLLIFKVMNVRMLYNTLSNELNEKGFEIKEIYIKKRLEKLYRLGLLGKVKYVAKFGKMNKKVVFYYIIPDKQLIKQIKMALRVMRFEWYTFSLLSHFSN